MAHEIQEKNDFLNSLEPQLKTILQVCFLIVSSENIFLSYPSITQNYFDLFYDLNCLSCVGNISNTRFSGNATGKQEIKISDCKVFTKVLQPVIN